VQRFENRSHTIIAYNCCPNRHCPKCSAQRRGNGAECEAELLPVPYYHVPEWLRVAGEASDDCQVTERQSSLKMPFALANFG
jgi:hypothetical protein